MLVKGIIQDEGLSESVGAIPMKIPLIPLLVTVCILDIILQLTFPAEPTSASKLFHDDTRLWPGPMDVPASPHLWVHKLMW